MEILQCVVCKNYENGEGNDNCLKCSDMKYFLMSRNKIKILYDDSYYNHTMDNKQEDNKQEDILTTISNVLDIKSATIFLQYFCLSYNQTELAEFWGIRQSTISKIIKKSITNLRNYLQNN